MKLTCSSWTALSASLMTWPQSYALHTATDTYYQPCTKIITDQNRHGMSEQDEAKIAYAAGKDAFERGSYRQAVTQFERATALAGKGTLLGGEVQLWLANAYAAVGEVSSAVGTCQAMATHPDPETRKQAKRLAYILQAPELATKPEWMSKIPDLAGIEGGNDYKLTQSKYGKTSSRPMRRLALEPEPLDLSQINTQDNQFVWVALIGCALVLGGLLWLS